MTIKKTLLCLSALFLAQGIFAATSSARPAEAEPFSYPNKLLDAPATLTTPLGAEVCLGKPKIVLEHTTLEALTALTSAPRVRDRKGNFARDLICVTGTENGQSIIAWLISSDNETITEAQIEWLKDRPVPPVCKPLPAEHLPIRLGKVGLGMTAKEIQEHLGTPSLADEDGWQFWFSQRFLRNARNLQELELNWLAVHFTKDGLVDKSFVAQVTNL